MRKFILYYLNFRSNDQIEILSMKPVKSHVFRGKRYKIEILPPSKVCGGTAYGVCDAPDTKNKKIKFSKDIKHKDLLEIICHEICHSLWFWKLTEKDVTEGARDLANCLKRFGIDAPDDLKKLFKKRKYKKRKNLKKRVK